MACVAPHLVWVAACRTTEPRQRPPQLDMENYPHLPLAQVRTTQASEYTALLGGVNQ